MKKTVLVIGFALLAAGLFAAGVQEDPLKAYKDPVKLTGSLQFTDGFAEINAGGKAYSLMAPGYMREVRFLKAGTKLSVEGYKVNASPRSPKPNQEMVLVEKASIDGKDFDLTKMGPRGKLGGADRKGGRGDRDGRMMGKKGGRWADDEDDSGENDSDSWQPGQGMRGRNW